MADGTSPEAVAATRQQMQDLEQASLQVLGPCPSDLNESNIEIRLEDGFVSQAILVRPAAAAATSPITRCPMIVYFHGGSFAYDSPNLVLSPARAFASYFNAIVVCPSYKLAPEHPFPAPAQSAWEIVSWLSKPDNINKMLDGEDIQFDPGLGFVLAGCSAGANLSAVIASISAAVKAGIGHDLVKGLPEITSAITGLFITIPYLLEAEMLPDRYASLYRSREENANAPWINAKSMETTRKIYKQDVHSPWFSPLNLNLARIKSYHPKRVYVQGGGLDIIRDDAIIYEKELRDESVAETKIDMFEDYHHVCWANLPPAEAHSLEMKEKTMDGMAWIQGLDWDRTKPLPY